MTTWPRAVCIGLAVLCGIAAMACGDEDRKPDPVALIVALIEQPPEDLPDGVSVSEVANAALPFGHEVAQVRITLTEDDVTHDAWISVFTTEDAPRTVLADEAEDYDLALPEEGEASCGWFDDLEGSSCIGRQGLTYISLDSYSERADSADPDAITEAAAESFEAIARHIAALERKATKKITPVTGAGLGALVTNVAPPEAPDGTEFAESVTPGGDDLLDEFEGHISIGWNAGTEWTVWYSVFENKSQARSYLNRYIDDRDVDHPDDSDAECLPGIGTKDQDDVWRCLEVVEESVVFSEHDGDGDDLDDGTVELLNAATEHLRTLRSGVLPDYALEEASAERTREPSRTGTPAETDTPAATLTPEPTAPAGPSVINAGPWTFVVTVTSNNCPGNDPAIGSELSLEYNFTEFGNDGMIGNGELMRVEQTLPGATDIGTVPLRLPTFELEAPITAGEFSGTGHLRLGFTAVDWAELDYVEDWGFCTIAADTWITP